ncbi:MAG: polysaccharide biosynthesis protein, partial [Symbiobacteriaceae bacterium]|nr:polysaccharide biosynthesis protein [Symbiobacteriaceae bacterium]
MVSQSEKPSYLQGAFILTVANLSSQFLGLFSKLAILWILGEEGVGIYNYPFAIYAILISLSSVGFNVAISKLVAERISRQEYSSALSIFHNSLRIMILLGFTVSILLAILAWPLAHYVHQDDRAFLAYLAMSPAALCNSWQAAYRGFFQGTQNMRPNAFSQIIEQSSRIIVMVVLAALFLPFGLQWGAFGATLGATAGALGSYLFLHFLFRRAISNSPWKSVIADQEAASFKILPTSNAYSEILRYAVPISFAGIGLPLYLLADSLLIVNRLMSSGSDLSSATMAYGAYANNAMSLMAMPTVLSTALFVSLVPAIAEACAARNSDSVREHSRSAIKIGLLLSLPAAAGIYMVAEPLCKLLG